MAQQKHQTPDRLDKVSLYPSLSFLYMNQLTKEGPDIVARMVIPALTLTLDKSLQAEVLHARLEHIIGIGPQAKQGAGLYLLPERF